MTGTGSARRAQSTLRRNQSQIKKKITCSLYCFYRITRLVSLKGGPSSRRGLKVSASAISLFIEIVMLYENVMGL